MSARKRRGSPRPSPVEAQNDALQRFLPLVSAEELPLLLAELQRPVSSALRANPLKVADPAQALGAWAAAYGWETSPVPYCPTGWWVHQAARPISQTLEHQLGHYYIQDAASMLPVELFTPHSGEPPLTLDLAASPGGKTTHLISRSGDQGLVLANDSSQSRIHALRLVLHTWGSVNHAVTCFAGERFGAWFPETFDRVLLDAPCSMQNLRSTESHPMRAISPRERDSLSVRQRNLLISAFQALKTGGEVVYATCTLSPEEDEGVLDELLRRFPGAVEIVDLSRRLPAPAPGLSSDGQRDFDPAVQRAARLWPHRFGTSGFFSALIQKRAPVAAPEGGPPARSLTREGMAPLPAARVRDLAARQGERYGFPLEAVLQAYNLELWQKGPQVWAVPRAFLSRFGELPHESIGLPLGTDTPDGFQPGHDWVSRFFAQHLSGREVLSPVQSAAWLRGEDLPGTPQRFAHGEAAVVVDEQGRFLGLGKAVTGRLRNMRPRRLAG